MDFLASIILGVVEGFTEFLPISSTGHLILLSGLLGLGQTDFLKSFEIVIQLGAILSVVVLYWRILIRDFALIKKVIFAFIPTAAIGFILYNPIKNYLFKDSSVVWALLIGGLVLVFFEYLHKEKSEVEILANISYKQAFWVGLFQSIAIVPGVSRAAATILGGMLIGFRRQAIVEFSFLLAIPTMLAASGLALIKNIDQFSGSQSSLLIVGFIVSFLTAIIGIKFLLKLVKHHSLSVFGVYRIALALVFWVLLL